VVGIRGSGLTSLGREPDPSSLVRAAVDRALSDAGLDVDAIDALVVANAAGEAFTSIGNVSVWTATEAGLAGTPAIRVDTGPSSGLAAVSTARGWLGAPGIDNVLVLGWEAMTSVPTEEATEILAGLMAADEREAGLSLPRLVACLTRAYLDRHDRSLAELDRVAHKAHRLAEANPIAQFGEVALDEIAASRVVADPLRLMHCAPLTDGAAALVVADEGPVEIASMGAASDHLAYTQRRTPPERFQATQDAAEACFASTETERSDVDVVELHDAFVSLEAINLEDLGFVPDGEGLDHVAEPEADALGPSPAVNPSGGLKARGHPVGATGLAQTVECVDQCLDRAANPVADAGTALVHSIGGFGNNVHVALLEARP
jgi:acetyl-CoA acetyltransferase